MADDDDRSDLIPIERELPERLAWFIRLRWMAAAGIFLGAWVATTWVVPGIPSGPLYAAGAGVLLYNGLFAGFCRRLVAAGMTPGNYRRLVYLQIGLDWVALAWVIHRSGGIQSPVALVFTFHLIIGAILLSRRAVYVQVGAAALLLGVLALVEELGVLPPVKVGWIEENVPGGDLSVLYHWAMLTGIFAISAYLSTSITIQLREKEKELFRSERSLDHAYADLKRFGEERAWFTRMTTHQLRSPLAAIQGMLDALPYVEPLSEKQADFVRRCQRRIGDLLVLIRDLLDLASAQRVMSDQKAEPVALLDCLEGAVETARERAQPKGVYVEVVAPEEPAVVCAQPDDVERIFSNLLDNAVKYTPDGGKVTFRIARLHGRIQAEVVDTGIGVAEEDQERIFGGFFRTEVAKATEAMGTGLGLSIVKQLVERWGGRIELISALGQGSRFAVTLPAVTRSDAGNACLAS